MEKYDYLVVGSGLFGAICSYEAKKKGKETRIKEAQVNQLVADIYGLNEQERQHIATQV